MTTRRSFLMGLTAAGARAAAAPFRDFVHVTDTHLISPAGVHPRLLEARRHFAHTRRTLPADLKAFRRDWRAEFAFLTGDLVDVYSFEGERRQVVTGQVEEFAKIAAASPLELYAGLGNHDVQHYGLLEGKVAADQSNVEEAKAAWIRGVACFRHGTYYAFHRDVGKTRWRFLMLNNGFYGHLPAAVQRAPERGLGRGQADWLAGQCRRYPEDPLVLGAHVPPRDGALAEIEQALGERRRLTLLFTGHIHESNYVRELPFRTARAFHVATPAYATRASQFRRVRLWEDRLELAAPGGRGEFDRELPIESR